MSARDLARRTGTMSEPAVWKDRIIDIGEKKITEWVNQILSSKGCQWPKESPMDLRRSIEEIVSFFLSSLDLPTRKDIDEINRRIETLNGKLVALSLKMEKMAEGGKAVAAGARKTTRKKGAGTPPA